jgi:hypothetical protein
MKKNDQVNRYLFEYNLVTINILSVFILFVCILINIMVEKFFDISFFETIGLGFLDTASNSEIPRKLISFWIVAFIVVLFWFILHEIIHAISYRIMGAKKENISFGVVLEKGIFYCKCNDYVSKSCILISVLAPFIMIGIITYIIGAIFNLRWLVYLSLINIMGAAGDLAMFSFFIFRDKDIRFKELDDSTVFCLETTEDLTKKKFMYVKLKEVLDKDIKKDNKNKFINITKPSLIILVGCFVVSLIALVLILV